MRAFTAIAIALLAVALLVPCARAAEATATAEPVSAPLSEHDPMSPDVPAVSDESEPVDVMLGLGGIGTDSRGGGAPAEALEVRWRFVVTGAPAGTPLHVWAEFAGAGEFEAAGTDVITIVTPGHDVLAGGMASVLLPEELSGVEVRLAGVEVVPRPAAPPGDVTVNLEPGTRAPRASSDGGEYLPFTGPSERLLVLATAFATFGAALRLAAARLAPDLAR